MRKPQKAELAKGGGFSSSGSSSSVRDLLLLTAFSDDETARESWNAVSPGLDLDTLAFDLHGLFPRIGDRLRQLGLATADGRRFDGMRKRLWAQNMIRARDVADAHAKIVRRGVEPLLTGGLAVLAHCRDWGLRPIAEVDLAVAGRDARNAIDALLDDGWQLLSCRRDGFLLDMRATMLTREGRHITVRWSPSGWPHDGLGRAVPFDIAGADVAVASRADILAFVTVDAERLPGYPLSRRFADALLLCEAGDDGVGGVGAAQDPVDWPAFVERVRSRNALPEARAFVEYLAGPLRGRVPADVTRELAASGRAPRISRRRHSAVASAFFRRCRGFSPLATARALPHYLCDVWELDGVARVPSEVVRRAARAAARRLRGGAGRRGQARPKPARTASI